MYSICYRSVWTWFHGLHVFFISILQEAKDTKILDVRIFNSYKGTGVAVVTCSYRIFMVNSIDDLRIRRLAEVPGNCFDFRCFYALVCFPDCVVVYVHSGCTGIMTHTAHTVSQVAPVHCPYALLFMKICGLWWWRKPIYVSETQEKAPCLTWQPY